MRKNYDDMYGSSNITQHNTSEGSSQVGLAIYDSNQLSFDEVIITLMDVCHHTHEQAEQCALLTHHKGSCIVKVAPLTRLEPYNYALNKRGIHANIEAL